MREMVSAENRNFVRGHDVEDLAKSLDALIDASCGARIGALNQAAARKNFSQEHMFATYEALFSGYPTKH